MNAGRELLELAAKAAGIEWPSVKHRLAIENLKREISAAEVFE